MSITIYSATGCARCKIVKGYMADHGIAYTEYDMKAEGKEEFQNFYKANRAAVFRGPEGIEFPIVTDGQVIRQGIGAAIAFLLGGEKLDGFFRVGIRHKEWVDGVVVSGGDPIKGEEFLTVLRFLKGQNLMLDAETDGRNSVLLEQAIKEGLIDQLAMLLPADMTRLTSEDVRRSMALVPQVADNRFIASVVACDDCGQPNCCLTPEEVGEMARIVAEATGSMKHKFIILAGPGETLTDAQLLKYRSKARTHQVFAEVTKAE